MKKVCVLLADGFEEIEGLTVVDLLRRAKIYVDTVSIMDDYIVHGAHGINVQTEDLFDEVKIDKRFLSDDLSDNGKIVLQEIFHLLKRTNKSNVCEGVETKEIVDFLVEEGCDELQGYYYYKPMSQNAFEMLLENIA